MKESNGKGENGKYRTASVARLITSFINGTLNEEQSKELAHWISESNSNRELFRYFTGPTFLLHLRQYRWN